MKARELINKELCPKSSFLSKLEGKKGKPYFNAIVLKTLFEKKDLYNLTESEIDDAFDNLIDPSLFGTNKERELNKKLLKGKLLRYKEFEENLSVKKKVLKKGGTTTIMFNSKLVTVDYHFIVENKTTGVIEVCKIKNSKTTLKRSGKLLNTRIDKSMELFLLQAVGESLYPNKKVYGSIIFLSCSDDLSDSLSDSFEEKDGNNIVRYHFDGYEITDMEKRINNAIANSNSNKCTGSNCNNCNYTNICNYIHKDYSLLKTIPPIAKANSTVKFTPSQQEFIDIKKGNYRVIAGAGSGKTTVISNHVAKLIEDGVSINDILMITYTNKGAEEIREKINYWLMKNNIIIDMDKLNIFTFNGFGYDLVKKEYKYFGFTKQPEVLDRLSKIDIIKELLDTSPHISYLNYTHPFMDMFRAKGAVIKLAEMFDTIKKEGIIMPDELTDEAYANTNLSEEDATEVLKLYKKYNKYLKEHNLLEFDDQILYAYDLLKNKDMVKKYGFEHIIVDEYQDSDMLQTSLLMLLSYYPFFKSLCVCGDDSQAIYSWRGADQRNILNFDSTFKNVQDIEMIENFRSTQEICDFANVLNSINKSSIKKNLKSTRHGEKPVLEIGNLDKMAESIKKDIKNGWNPHEIAIITRNKSTLITLQRKLDELDIPSIISVSELLIDNDKVKNLIGFTNFLVDNELDLHFAEYLQVAKNDDFNNSSDLYQFVQVEKNKFLDEYDKLPDDVAKLEYFYKLLEPIANSDKAVKKLIELCFDKQFKTIKALRDFLNKLEPYKADYYIEKSADMYEAVTLSTAHSSKGREFDKVYVYLDKFKYPSTLDSVSAQTPEVEEERRLLFVACTRAKKDLTVYGDKINGIYKEVQSCLKAI